MSLRRKLQQFITLNNYVEAARTGTDSLELTDAVSSKLDYLNVYGKCIQKNLLPAGYIEVETGTNAASTYINTGILDDVDDIEIELRAAPKGGSWYILQSRSGSSGPIYGISGANSGDKISFGAGSVKSVTSTITRETNHVVYIRGYHRNGTISMYVKDETTGEEDTQTDTYDTNNFVSSTTNFGIFGNGSNYLSSGHVIYRARIWKSGVLVADYIPVTNNTTTGFYDMVSQTIKLPSSGSVVAGPVKTVWNPTPNAPVDIFCNNGVIKGASKNLFNAISSNIIAGYWLNNTDGTPSQTDSNYYYNSYMLVEPNTTYVFFGRRISDNKLSEYNRISWYDNTKTWISNSSYTQNRVTVATSPANAVYARISCNPTGSTVSVNAMLQWNWMFYKGTAEETFTPYGIITNGNQETLDITGKNLFNINEMLPGYINANGELVEDNAFGHSTLIPVEVGSTYVFSGVRSSADGNKRVHGYDANGTWVQQLALDPSAGAVIGGYYLTITIPSGISYIVISGIRVGTTPDAFIQVEKSPRPTKYEAYTKQSYYIPTLLYSSDDIKDSFELKSGTLEYNVGIKVFDGTETWLKGSNTDADGNSVYYINIGDKLTGQNIKSGYCSHYTSRVGSYTILKAGEYLAHASNPTFYFDGGTASTVTEWTNWLAEQYANNTPVFIVYPKVSSTETIGAKTLSITAGTNVIERIADIDDLEINTTYKKLR